MSKQYSNADEQLLVKLTVPLTSPLTGVSKTEQSNRELLKLTLCLSGDFVKATNDHETWLVLMALNGIIRLANIC